MRVVFGQTIFELRLDFKLILWGRSMTGWRSWTRYLICWELHLVSISLKILLSRDSGRIIVAILRYWWWPNIPKMPPTSKNPYDNRMMHHCSILQLSLKVEDLNSFKVIWGQFGKFTLENLSTMVNGWPSTTLWFAYEKNSKPNLRTKMHRVASPVSKLIFLASKMCVRYVCIFYIFRKI